MNNKKLIIGSIVFIICIGFTIIIFFTTANKTSADETYYIIEDENIDYGIDEETTIYLPD